MGLYLRALMVGVDQLVQFAEANDVVCKWHLAGYRKKGNAVVRLYVCVAALAARPSEGMLLELMQDDRFLLHADRCWTVLFEEMNYLSVLAPPLLYSSVAALLSVDASLFKSDVLGIDLGSIGYLYLDLWKPLSEELLCYAMGDVRENIERLKRADPQ